MLKIFFEDLRCLDILIITTETVALLLAKLDHLKALKEKFITFPVLNIIGQSTGTYCP